MGMVKCQLGDMAAGCQLLHESAGLYQWMPHSEKVEPTVQDIIKVAEVFSINVQGGAKKRGHPISLQIF